MKNITKSSKKSNKTQKSKVFQPLIASSLALALGVSVAYGTDVTQSGDYNAKQELNIYLPSNNSNSIVVNLGNTHSNIAFRGKIGGRDGLTLGDPNVGNVIVNIMQGSGFTGNIQTGLASNGNDFSSNQVTFSGARDANGTGATVFVGNIISYGTGSGGRLDTDNGNHVTFQEGSMEGNIRALSTAPSNENWVTKGYNEVIFSGNMGQNITGSIEASGSGQNKIVFSGTGAKKLTGSITAGSATNGGGRNTITSTGGTLTLGGGNGSVISAQNNGSNLINASSLVFNLGEINVGVNDSNAQKNLFEITDLNVKSSLVIRAVDSSTGDSNNKFNIFKISGDVTFESGAKITNLLATSENGSAARRARNVLSFDGTGSNVNLVIDNINEESSVSSSSNTGYTAIGKGITTGSVSSSDLDYVSDTFIKRWTQDTYQASHANLTVNDTIYAKGVGLNILSVGTLNVGNLKVENGGVNSINTDNIIISGNVLGVSQSGSGSNNIVTDTLTFSSTSAILVSGTNSGGGVKNRFVVSGDTTFDNTGSLVISADSTASSSGAKHNIFKFGGAISGNSATINQILTTTVNSNLTNTANILSFDGLSADTALNVVNINDASTNAEATGYNYIGKSLTVSGGSTMELTSAFGDNTWSNATYQADKLTLNVTGNIYTKYGKNYINVKSVNVTGEIDANAGNNNIATSGDFSAGVIKARDGGNNNIIIGGNATLGNISTIDGTTAGQDELNNFTFTGAISTVTMTSNSKITVSGSGNNIFNFQGAQTANSDFVLERTAGTTGKNIFNIADTKSLTFASDKTLNTLSGETEITFQGTGGSFGTSGSGKVKTDNGTTTFIFSQDAGTYAISGELSANNGGQNIIDLSDKSATISTDLTLSGSPTGSGGNIIKIGDGKSLSFTDSGANKTLSTTSGVSQVNFLNTSGTFNGDLNTSGGTMTFSFQDNGTYTVSGNLGASNTGKNIFDLSSKSITISNDLTFSGSSVDANAGNIINIGNGRSLTLSGGGGSGTLTTNSGLSTVNFNGASGNFKGKVSTTSGVTLFNFNQDGDFEAGSEFSASNGGKNIINVTSHNATLNSGLVFKGSSVSSGSGNIIDIGSGKTLTLTSGGSGNVDTQSGKTHINFASGSGTLAGGVSTTSGADTLTTITLQAGASGTINGAVAGGGSNDILYKVSSAENTLKLGGTGNDIHNLTVEDAGNAVLAGNDATIDLIDLSGSGATNLTLKNSSSTITSLTNTGVGVFSLDGTNNAVVASVTNAINSSTLILNFDGKGQNQGAQLTLSGADNVLKTLTVGAGSTNNKLFLASGKTTFENLVNIANAGTDITLDLADGVEAYLKGGMQTIGTSTFVIDATSANKGATISGGDVRASELKLVGGSHSSSATLKNRASTFTTLTTTGTGGNTLTLDTSSNAVSTTIRNAVSGENLNVVLGGTSNNKAVFTLENANGGNTRLKSLTLKNTSSATQNVFKLNSGTTTIVTGINIEASKGLNTSFLGNGTTLVNDVTNSGDFDLDFNAVRAILQGGINTQSSGNTAIALGGLANAEITGSIQTADSAQTNVTFDSAAQTLALQGLNNAITSITANGSGNTLKLDTVNNNAVTTTVKNAITGNNLNVQLGGKDNQIATLTLKNTDGDSEIQTLTLTEDSSDVSSNVLNLESNKTKISGGVSVGDSQGLTINLENSGVNLESNITSSGNTLVNFKEGTNTITGNVTASAGETKLAIAKKTDGVITGKTEGANSVIVDFAVNENTDSNSLSFGSSGNTISQAKVADNGNAIIKGSDVAIGTVTLGENNQAKLALQNTVSNITTFTVNNDGTNGDSTLTLDASSNTVTANVTNAINGENLDVVLGGSVDYVATLTLNNANNGDTTIKSLSLDDNTDVTQNIFNLSAGTTTVTEGVTIADNKGLTINFKNEKTTLVNDIKNSEATLINFEGSDGIINGVVDTLAGKTDINVANNGTIVKGIKTADSNAVTNIAFEAGANTLKLQGSANAITSISAAGDTNILSLDTKNNAVTADVKNGITGDKLKITFGGVSGKNATLTLENSNAGSSIRSISVAENSGRENNILNLKANTTTVSGGVSVGGNQGLTINLEDNGVSLASNLVSSGDTLVNFRKGTNTITGSVTASAGETKLAIADSVNGVISGVVSDAGKSAGASGIIVDFAENQNSGVNSLSFGSEGNTISQAKVADSGNAFIKGKNVAIGTVTLGDNTQSKLTLQNTTSDIATLVVNNSGNDASKLVLDVDNQDVVANVTNAINGEKLDVVLGGDANHIATLTLNNASNGNTTIKSLSLSDNTNVTQNIFNLSAGTTTVTEGVTIGASKGLTINLKNAKATLVNDVNNSGNALINFEGSDGIIQGKVIANNGANTDINLASGGFGTITGNIETDDSNSATTDIVFASGAKTLKLQGQDNAITSVSANDANSILKLDAANHNNVTATVKNAITGDNLNIQLAGNSGQKATLTLNNANANKSEIKSLTLTEQTSSIGDNFLNLVKDTTAISGGVSIGASQGLTINLKENNVNLESNLVSSGGLLVNFEKGTNTITGSITANSGETKLAVAGDVNGVVTGKVSGADNAYVEFATKATAQNSLTLNFAGNSLKELKVTDSGDAVLDGLDVDISDVKIGGTNSAKLTLKNTDSDITTLSVGASGDSTFILDTTDQETTKQNSVLANITNAINGENLDIVLGGQGDKVATLTLNNTNGETVLKSLTLSQNSDINDNILNLNASTTSFVGDVGVNVESGKGLTINFTGAGTTLDSDVTTEGVSEVNFNGSKDKLDGNVSTSGTSTLNFNGASSTITGAVSSSGSGAKTTINVSGTTNGVIGGKVSYDNSGANVLNFLTGTTNSLTLNAEGNQLTELNVGNNGSSTLAGKDVVVATMKLGDSASANLTLKNTKTDITTLNAIGTTSTLALNSASNGVEASVTNAVNGNSLTVHFVGTKTDDKPTNTTLFTLKAGGNQLKAITVASDSKGNTLSLESGATSINDKVNIADNSAIDFDLGNTASAQLTLTNDMQNAGVANVNFNKSDGSFSGAVSTSGITTFAFAEDSGTYGINGNLSVSGAGKNIIDLSSKSATIGNDLAFAGSNVANGAGNIINIGASKTLSLKSGSDVKSMNTASGNTYVNLDGASATFGGNAETSGGAVAFNFNSTDGILDGDISTSGGITTFNIANAGSGITKGSIDTSSSGVTNVVFADGEGAKSLTLKGASNEITTVSVGGSNNTFALDTTDRSVNAEIKNAIAGSALDVKLGGGTNTATLTLNNEGTNTTIKSLALTQESGADKNILNLKANTTTINSGISVADKQGLTINLDGTTTTLANTLSNTGNTILNFNATEGMLTGNIVASGGTTGINFKGAKGTITGAVSTATDGTTNIDVANASNGIINGLVNGSGTTNVTFAAKSADTANTLSLNGADNTITSLKVSDGGESVLLGNKVTMTNMVVGETDSAELTLKNANSVITTLTSAGADSVLSLDGVGNSVLATVDKKINASDLTLDFKGTADHEAKMVLTNSDGDSSLKTITLGANSSNNKLALQSATTTFAEKISVGDTSGIAFDLDGANTTLKLSKNLENSGNTAFNFNATDGILEGNISTSGGSTTLNVVNTGSGITKGSIDTTGGETNIVYGASATSLALQGASNKITNVTSAGDSNILALDTTTQGVSAEITNAVGGETLAVQLKGTDTSKAELTLNNANGSTTLASLTLTGVSTDVTKNVLNLNNATTKITAGIELEANKALSINISGKDAQSTTLDNDLLNTAGKLKLDFKSGSGILDGTIATAGGTTEINVADASNGIIKGAVSGEGNTTIAFATKTDANTNSLTLEGENNKVTTVSVVDNANAFLKGKDVEVATLQLGTSGSANLTLQNTDSAITTLTLGGGATALTLDGVSNAVNASVANAVSGNNLTLTLNGKAGATRSGAQGATFTLKNGDNTIQTLSLGANSSGNKLVLEQGKTTINTQVDVNDNADLSVDFANGVELEVTSGFATTLGTSTFNVDASGAGNSASVSGGDVNLTNLNLTGGANSATMAFKNANTTIANVISSGSATLDLSQATGANTRSGTATTTTITNGVEGENLTLKLGGANTGVATLTLNNANGNSTIKALELGGDKNILNLNAHTTTITEGISNIASKELDINFVSAKLANNLENAGILKLDFNGSSVLDGSLTTTDSGTTDITLNDNARVLISGDVMTGTTLRGRATPSTASTNVTLGANSALALQGHNNHLSKVTMSNKGVDGETNYLLLTKEKFGDGPARKAVIDELYMSNDKTALILGVQLAETEADAFVFEKTSGTKQTDGATTTFNASPDAGNGGAVDGGVVGGGTGDGSTSEKPDVEQIQSKHKITITLRSGTTLESVGKDGAVLVASVKNDTNDANLRFASKSVAYGDFSQGDATFVTEQRDGYTNYLLGTIKNIQTIVAEQEITATAFTLNYDLYVANFNSLNKRMGDLRANPHSHGVWARVFNGAQTNNFGIGSKSNYTTIQSGYDYAFGGEGFNNYLGFALSYALSMSTARNEFVDKNKQRAINDIYSQAAEVAMYNSFVSDIGWYNDTIAKFSYIMSDFTIDHVGENISTDNSTKNYAFTLSNEFGYLFALGESKEWSITPQLEVGFGYFNQSDFKQTLEQSGAYIISSADAVLTLRTRAGSSFGYDFKRFTQGKGIDASLYVGAFYEFDYIQGGEIRFQTSDAPDVVTNRHSDLKSDGRVVVNVGTNMTIKDNTRLYFDFEKSFVGEITTDYQVNFGVRYSFGESDGYTPVSLGIEEQESTKAPLKIEEKGEAKKEDKQEGQKDKDTKGGEKKEQESKKEVKKDKANEDKKVEEKKEAKPQTEATKKENKKEVSSKSSDKKVADKKNIDKKVTDKKVAKK